MKLRILLVVDDPEDRARMLGELRRDFPDLEAAVAFDAATFRDAVATTTFHLAVVADRVAWSTPSEILCRLQAERPECPVLFRGRNVPGWSWREALVAGPGAELLHSQKMEVLGRLAGGVAHDFNNLLTAILGYAHMLLGDVPEGGAVADGLREISRAGERAVALTRQLLAFGRGTGHQPRDLDLNRLVTDLNKMLRRLIGEDIELVTDLSDGLHGIHADPGHLEQVVVNLAVNACDAIQAAPGSDRPRLLTIATANVNLPRDAPLPPDAAPGDYVALTVSDTGCGMTEEVRQRIFEPFFTTKEQRNGTGLGLATVYGIVRQGNGHVEVESEPDRGTVFRLYFPAIPVRAEAVAESADPPVRDVGMETLLVVEDDENLRSLLLNLFKPCGFTVLAAPTAEEALGLSARHPGPIHLLIADVVLPRLGGPDLAKRLREERPGLRTLFISGYNAEAIAPKGPLPSGAPFLQKPFTPTTILRLVRNILDG